MRSFFPSIIVSKNKKILLYLYNWIQFSKLHGLLRLLTQQKGVNLIYPHLMCNNLMLKSWISTFIKFNITYYFNHFYSIVNLLKH